MVTNIDIIFIPGRNFRKIKLKHYDKPLFELKKFINKLFFWFLRQSANGSLFVCVFVSASKSKCSS